MLSFVGSRRHAEQNPAGFGLKLTQILLRVALSLQYLSPGIANAQCDELECSSPPQTFRSSIINVAFGEDDCFEDGMVVQYVCNRGFRQLGDGYSATCNGTTGDWNPNGSCQIDVPSVVLATLAAVIIIFLMLLILWKFIWKKIRSSSSPAVPPEAPLPDQEQLPEAPVPDQEQPQTASSSHVTPTYSPPFSPAKHSYEKRISSEVHADSSTSADQRVPTGYEIMPSPSALRDIGDISGYELMKIEDTRKVSSGTSSSNVRKTHEGRTQPSSDTPSSGVSKPYEKRIQPSD